MFCINNLFLTFLFFNWGNFFFKVLHLYLPIIFISILYFLYYSLLYFIIITIIIAKLKFA